MDNLTVEGWCKKTDAENPVQLERISFHISPECHLALEAAEEELHKTHAAEKFIDVDADTLNLEVPSDVGPLSGCQLRVYLGSLDNRGQFHLVCHAFNGNSLVYTNPVMVDQLG